MGAINVGSWSDKVRAALGIQGGENPLPESSEELVPVMVVELERPEWLFAGGEQPMVGGTTQTGLALNNSIVQLRNPPESGCLVVVEYVLAYTQTVVPPTLSRRVGDPAAATSVGGGYPRDFRLAGASQTFGPAEIRRENGTVFGATMTELKHVAGLAFEYDRAIVLPPGTVLNCTNATLAEPLRCYFTWRVRPLFKGVRG